MEKWFVAAKKADFYQIAEKFQIDPVIARLIRNRDIIGEESIELYLNSTLDRLHSPRLLKDGEMAASLIREKIDQKKKIRVIGDYDIDGVCSTYILLKALKRCGALVDTEIPDRVKDGYGINEHLIELAHKDQIDTIITCDNGIAAKEQVAFAKSLGMTVVITDHHDIPYLEEAGKKTYVLPEADAVINPKRQDCGYPFKNLCGAGVAYKFIELLFEQCSISKEELKELIPFTAIATVGDIVDLVDENRIFVKTGLKMLEETNNIGLRELIEINQLNGKSITSYHVGFILGPCINASGRLTTAKKALNLLCTDSSQEAKILAVELKDLNDSRKDMTAQGVAQAIEIIEGSTIVQDKILVVYLPHCHESLAGIIAGRLREKYHKPAFVLTRAEEGVKGSGRSIEAYNMFEGMAECREVFTKFGGHPMAAGLSLLEENVEVFRRQINERCSLEEEDFIPKVAIDVPMPIDYLTEELICQLEILEPFGKGNSKPLFAEKNLKLLEGRILGKNRNVLKLKVENEAGTVMDALYFGELQNFEDYIKEKFGETELNRLYLEKSSRINLSCTYYPSINEYRGIKTLQIVIQNYK